MSQESIPQLKPVFETATEQGCLVAKADSLLQGMGAISQNEEPEKTENESQDTSPPATEPANPEQEINETPIPISEPSKKPSPPPPRQIQTPRSKQLRTSGPIPTSEEVAPLSELFLKGQVVKNDSPETLAIVVRNLEDKRDDLINEGQIEKSMRVQTAVENARAQQLQALKKSIQDDQIQSVKSRQEETKTGYNELNKNYQIRLQELEEHIKQQQAQLDQRQQQEIQDFNAEWTSDLKQRLYNRSSQQLRVLRLQQQLLLSAKRFSEARQVASLGNQLEKQEISQNHRQMILDYKKALYSLQTKHKKEKDVLDQIAEEQRMNLTRKKETMELPFENRFKVLQTEQENTRDTEKVWNRVKRSVEADPIAYVVGEKQKAPKVQTRNVKADSGILVLPPLPIQTPRKQKEETLSKTQ